MWIFSIITAWIRNSSGGDHEASPPSFTAVKPLYAGISNYNEEYTRKASAIAKELHCPLIVNQRRYSIFDRTIEEDGVKNCCKEIGMESSPSARWLRDFSRQISPWNPGRQPYRKGSSFPEGLSLTPERLHQIDELNKLAAERGQTLAQMALSWILKDDEVASVLIGASRPEQIEENISIVEHLDFTEEELKKIDEISREQA